MRTVNTDRPAIVVGVDGSPSALHAVRWAAREASRRTAPLRLLHVCQLIAVRHPRQVAPPPEFRAAVLGQGRHWLDEAADTARTADPGVTLGTGVQEGLTTDVLVRESRSAELVVVGSRGLGGFAGLLLGSVAVGLSAHAHCPVVVVRPSPPGGPAPEDGPVVVGVDGSELSDGAVEFAFAAAQARHAPLVAVHTWLDIDAPGAWLAPPWTPDWEEVHAAEVTLLEERLRCWMSKFPDVEVRTVVERDRPERALTKQDAGAALVVVGSRGRGALAGLGLGSVSQSLLHHAGSPVAVVRKETP